MVAGCPRPPTFEDPPGTGAPLSPFMDPRLAGATVTLADAPPPISGGTLVALDTMVIASDPDRDRIVVLDRIANDVLGVAELPPGAEPTRIALDAAGRAHVVLRGTGEIYSFAAEFPTSGERRAVCPMPRGIAFEEATGDLHVACRGGELVTLPAAGGAPTRTVRIEGGDLRDVVVDGDLLYVTRFRSAELLRIDGTGAVVRSSTPGATEDTSSGSFVDGEFVTARFHPSIAWRTIPIQGGGLAMVHQRASDTELQTAPGAYYSTSGCNRSIVQSAVSIFRDGAAMPSPNLMEGSVTADVAVSPDGQTIAVVNAGNQQGDAAVVVHDRGELENLYGSAFGGCLTA
jgi:DNA-binding beta-propeller fold protein YncE